MISSVPILPAATVSAIGNPHTPPVFDQGMWAPNTPLIVATTAQATLPATGAGAASGQGLGAALQTIERH